MRRDIEEDLERLNALKLDLDRVPAYADRKLQALGELLAKESESFRIDGKKCLVFTQYMHTAEYIYRNTQRADGKAGPKDQHPYRKDGLQRSKIVDGLCSQGQ